MSERKNLVVPATLFTDEPVETEVTFERRELCPKCHGVKKVLDPDADNIKMVKCDGCDGQDKTLCMYICPHDLMKLDRDGSETGWAMKAWNQEPEQCWECYACVKVCPQQAIEVRHYADIVPMGAFVQPVRSTDSIVWSIAFRNGDTKRFEFPIRTTPEDSIDPYRGKPAADISKIGEPGCFTLGGVQKRGDPSELIRT